MNLKPRKILPEILKFIGTDDIIIIHGARQTGKTSLMKLIMQHTGPNVFLDLEDSRYRDICNAGAHELVTYLRSLGYDTDKRLFVYLDEIQYLRNPTELLKLLHDHYNSLKLIVSGSSSFEIKSKFKDSLVGRTVNFELYPLDFQEFLWFKNIQADLQKVESKYRLKELKPLFKQYVLWGGYPKIVLTDNVEQKETYLQQIIDTYIYRDIRDLANIRDIEKFNRLVRILAAQTSSLLKTSQLSIDVRISKPTLVQYLFILESTYIIRRIYPYARNIKTELTKLPKLFFIDSGLANLLHYRRVPIEITGEMLETAVFSELLKNRMFTGYGIHYWRTKNGNEIDFILDFADRLLALEVKINSSRLTKRSYKKFLETYSNTQFYGLCMENVEQSKSCLYPYQLFAHITTEHTGR